MFFDSVPNSWQGWCAFFSTLSISYHKGASWLLWFLSLLNICVETEGPALATLVLRALEEIQKEGVSVYWGCHTQGPQTGGLKPQKFLFSSFSGLEIRDGVLSCWFLLRAPPLGLQTAVFSLRFHIVFLLCMSASKLHLYIRTLVIWKDPLKRPHFNLLKSVKILFPNKVTFWDFIYFLRDTIQPITQPSLKESSELLPHTKVIE